MSDDDREGRLTDLLERIRRNRLADAGDAPVTTEDVSAIPPDAIEVDPAEYFPEDDDDPIDGSWIDETHSREVPPAMPSRVVTREFESGAVPPRLTIPRDEDAFDLMAVEGELASSTTETFGAVIDAALSLRMR